MAGAEIQMVILLIATSLVVVICSIPLVVSNLLILFLSNIIVNFLEGNIVLQHEVPSFLVVTTSDLKLF